MFSGGELREGMGRMVARVLVVTLLLVSLTACRGSGPAPAVATTTTPSPSRSAVVTLVASPILLLPVGCDEAAILGVVHDFIAAFNAGDQVGLARVFPAKGSDSGHRWTGELNQLRWFTLTRANPSKGVGALDLYTRDTLLAYFSERHAQHEQMRLVELVVNPDGGLPGASAIAFRITRVADDLPESAFGGKGGVSCEHAVIFLWSQGAAFDSPATPVIRRAGP